MERPIHPCPCPNCRTGTDPIADHHSRLNLILSRLDEQQRRWVAAQEAQRLGYGGFNAVVREVAGLGAVLRLDQLVGQPAGVEGDVIELLDRQPYVRHDTVPPDEEEERVSALVEIALEEFRGRVFRHSGLRHRFQFHSL